MMQPRGLNSIAESHPQPVSASGVFVTSASISRGQIYGLQQF